MLRDSYPRELLKWLGAHGCKIEQPYAGIYYVGNAGFFDTQIIVSGELSPKNHIWLKALTDRLKEHEARLLLETVAPLRSRNDVREWVESVLQVAFKENRQVFDCIKEEEQMACEALLEFMKPEVDKKIEDTTERINELNNKLLTDNRLDDLKRATRDRNYQNQLFKEYGL